MGITQLLSRQILIDGNHERGSESIAIPSPRAIAASTHNSCEVILEILKATFASRTASENWQIDSLCTLKVLSEDLEHGYGKVRADMHLQGQKSFGPVTYYLGQSIVPVVAISNDLQKMKCIGTGFFVSCTGLLMTAAHVIADPIDRNYGNMREISPLTWQSEEITLGVMIPTHPIFEGTGYVFREIEWATFLAEKTDSPLPFGKSKINLNADIAICKIRQPEKNIPYQPLAMIQRGMRGIGATVGKTATAIGYGEMLDEIPLERTGPSSIRGTIPFELNISSGTVLERFDDNSISKSAPSPGPCFSASIRFPPGMSGSPIFDHDGIYAHGVVSMGLSDQNGPVDHGFASTLGLALHLPIGPLQGKSLLDLFSSRSDGLIIMQGPGDI